MKFSNPHIRTGCCVVSDDLDHNYGRMQCLVTNIGKTWDKRLLPWIPWYRSKKKKRKLTVLRASFNAN